MELAWVILLGACLTQHVRPQATVDVNPQESIPGIGALVGGDDEKPILERWQFWLGIGLAAAFFIVLVYFVFRGFKSYKRHNEERKQEQQSEQKQEEQNGSQHDIENPLPPFSSKKSTLECQKTIDVDELARRTGRRKKDLITAHSKHHHHRSSSLASEAASVTSTTAASASDTVDTRL